ncbi:class I SAM-dependent methyltransferase [bacterium]|nr:class I SAM-dependent methyltransferase [candidate division CSSED10-310 bacterium]
MISHENSVDPVSCITAASPPVPWADTHSIQWSDPAFSRRILAEHLDHDHDRVSRRASIIDAHVDWIHNRILNGKPSRILDLGCGPGLYTQRLAQRGHSCTGIDCSPAAIEFARNANVPGIIDCNYVLGDVRTLADYRTDGHFFDLVMFIYGEFSMMHPDDAAAVVNRCRHALRPGGLFLLEVMTHDAVVQMGTQSRYWALHRTGVLSDKPYICLEESFYFQEIETAVIRYWILESGSHELHAFTQTCRAWTNDTLLALLISQGFNPEDVPSRLAGIPDDNDDDLIAWVMRLGTKQSEDYR